MQDGGIAITKTGRHSLCSYARQININLVRPSTLYRDCDLSLGVIRSRPWPFAREYVGVSSPQVKMSVSVRVVLEVCVGTE